MVLLEKERTMTGLMVWINQERKRMRKKMEDLFEEVCRDFHLPTPPRLSPLHPLVELFEKERHLILRTDIEGIHSEDLDVSVSVDRVTIEGKIRYGDDGNERSLFFSRTVPLPQRIETDKTKGNYKNGVLELMMPLSEKKKIQVRKIKIK
jgi:HSP20 family protein